jgi:hypothetical protein
VGDSHLMLLWGDRSAPIVVCWLGGSSSLGCQFTLGSSVAPFQRGDRREGDDLGTAQRFEEWLEAATDQAGQPTAVDLDLADPRSARQLPRGWGADERHMNSLPELRLRHAQRLTTQPAAHIV